MIQSGAFPWLRVKQSNTEIDNYAGLVLILLTQFGQRGSSLFYLVYIECTNNYAQTSHYSTLNWHRHADPHVICSTSVHRLRKELKSKN